MSSSDIIGVIGLAVSILGFTLAIVQLRRTATATQETAQAIRQTLHRMNVNHLLVLLPQLRLIENDLDQAAADNDRKLAQRTLISYAHTASQVASLLEGGEDDVDTKLIERLRASARAASNAKGALVSDSRQPVRTVTKLVSLEIGDVSGMAAGMIAQYQTKVN